MTRRYLDHNAGTPLGEAARVAMARLLDAPPGNPSSIHGAGRAARSLLERARREVAALVGATSEAVIFCSGGTEAISLGVCGLARRARAQDATRTRILIGAAEHPAVHGAAELLVHEGFERALLPVDRGGSVEMDAARALVDASCAVVAVQAVNHETGVLQPVSQLAAHAHSVGAALFCDAVQAAGKLPLALTALGASAISISSHKLYGPAGAGALVLAPGVDIAPRSASGHQERGRRPGTEAVWSLVGFGAAAGEAMATLATEAGRELALRTQLEAGLVALGAQIFGLEAPRLPNTTLCAFSDVNGQLAVMALDLLGFELSTGAACTSGSVKPSAVLLAAGHAEKLARCALRISIGRATTSEDLHALLVALPTVIARVRGA